MGIRRYGEWAMEAVEPDQEEGSRTGTAVRERALAYLKSHHCLNLATHGTGDGVWATTVFYANDGFDLFFFSRPSARHVQSIGIDPRVAATINDDVSDWRAVRGIQLTGLADCVDSTDRATVLTLFQRRFPFAEELWDTEEESPSRESPRQVYRVQPNRLFFTDHEYASGPREVPL